MADGWHMSTSELRSKTLTFGWTVKDFETAIKLSKSNRELESPTFAFSIERSLVDSWYDVNTRFEVMYPPALLNVGSVTFSCQLKVKEISNRLFVSLHRTDKRPVVTQGKEYLVQSLHVKFRVSLMSKEGARAFSKESVVNLQGSIGIEFDRNIVSRGDLKVHCELIVYGKMVHTPLHSKPTYNHDLSRLDLGFQMERLRREESFTNFTLVVGEENFQVHKVILAAHSPVFEKMFETDMREKKESCATLDGVTPDIVENLLTYMYTGEVPDLEEEVAEELLQVADEYEIAGLIALCEVALCDSLTINNVIDRFLLADTHNASQLRSFCKHFIQDHLSEVKESGEWCQLKERHELYIEILETQLPPSKKIKTK